MFYEIFFLWWIMEWKWKYFKPEEIACKGKICRCGRELWDKAEYGENMPNYLKGALDTLDMLRGKWGKPIVLNSAHRCAKHNASVGGAKNRRLLSLLPKNAALRALAFMKTLCIWTLAKKESGKAAISFSATITCNPVLLCGKYKAPHPPNGDAAVCVGEE